MTVKKVTWKSLLPSCYKSNKNTMAADSEEKILKLKPLCQFQRLSLSDVSDPSSPLSVNDLSTSLLGSNLHVFSFAELRLITHNFARCNLLGEGGFGPVYKGFIDDKLRLGLKAQPVAVKALDLDGLQGHREWLIGQNQLQKVEILLINGYSATLPWSTRMKIALGAAKGLAFLHEGDKPVIYRDFKSSNILLDSDYNCKLSDFGLAKDGPEGGETHVTTRVMGTQGYAAPEYIMTGHLTTMSDVYSFGVVLLELLTGKRSMDNTRPSREQSLVEWARPLLRDPKKLDRLIDPRLEGQYSSKGAQRVAALAYKCLSHQPKPRPNMGDVVKILESVQGFEDEFVGTFVYVVPNENEDSSKEFFDKKESKRTEEGISPIRRSWRNRIKLPQTSVANSESPCRISI
ncbi:hypothetical protein COLO4_21156 [Corchorus olitorius]|uniref:Protein kinase domain-containing protein n=1 Tax=Corchorus olitorius TaxID=93759 RepID=A0A1R3IV29_9ROSI|nr:hypothetical protein COLO4_21156 [Corchorus olitorius]